MPKTLISEQKLIETINVALAHDSRHKDKPCRVEVLRKVTQPNQNWEVDTFSTSGHDLLHLQD